MPPTDASAHAAPAADRGEVADTCPADSGIDTAPEPMTPEPAIPELTTPEPVARPVAPDREAADTAATDCEDTLDLRLPDELLALLAEQAGPDEEPGLALGLELGPDPGPGPGPKPRSNGAAAPRLSAATIDHGLLDGVAEWGPVGTPVGTFHLVPVVVERDLPLISRWMNDPAVAEFWDLAGAQSVTGAHLRAQLDGDGRSVPCVGVLDGTPMSYWEIYRADLDPLARHYPARPHDTGIHLLVGEVADRGRGLGSALLRAVADLALDRRPACARVVAEPALRNTPSVAAFLTAGFRFSAEIDLPDKRAALMVRDRSLRDLL
ncbi:GNAT family N-acetyltransferase [Streptomyces sp. NPDC102394]|uniref:GNAT family N-acetyltransferase n=1 Tax=Streptomyces sp. NPDC102394 TaxID=3366167 RepID=UPI0037F6C94D